MTAEDFYYSKKWGNPHWDRKAHTQFSRSEMFDFAESFLKERNKALDLAGVRLPLPDSEEITKAAMEYAEIEGDDPFDNSVRDAAHFVGGATWYHKRIKGNGA